MTGHGHPIGVGKAGAVLVGMLLACLLSAADAFYVSGALLKTHPTHFFAKPAPWAKQSAGVHLARVDATRPASLCAEGAGRSQDAASPDAVKDVLSGVVSALASVPTSIAFAQIAGVNPLVGLWASVIVGFIMSVAGASPGLIAGAAGVVAVPLAPLISQHGVAYMAPAVFMAAVLVMLCVATKLSRAVSLVSDNVMFGFLNGLGCLLIKSQVFIHYICIAYVCI